MPANQLWYPTDAILDSCNLTRFASSIGFKPPNYTRLHEWSIKNKREFWCHLWEFASVLGERGELVLEHEQSFINSIWFPNARLNFTENLLQGADDDIAIVSITELGSRTELTFSDLRRRVSQFARALTEIGVESGDRVAAYLPNVAETVIAMLGTASIGAVWSSCSPDFGFQGAFDRFCQISPKVLIACDGYTYNGKQFDVSQNVISLEQNIDSIKQVITLNFVSKENDDFDEIFRNKSKPLEYQWFPFNHPLYVMYSSGTTGQPKCIVHGAGGTLIQHLKEHQLHVNLSAESKMLFYTTCGWMMWNWLVSALASGSSIVLYEGAAFWPNPNALIQIIEKESVNVFGAGAKYYSALEKSNVKPKEELDLTCLDSLQSTGSPLAPESFDFVYRDIKEDVQMASISGGTDLISCFALGVPWLPVHRGELQGPGLGMAMDVFDELGNSIRSTRGELVCTQTFPSKPIGFWNDPDDHKFSSAYFDKFSNIWAHGDFAEINSDTGGLIIHGRSDAVLNPGGVRIGTAEIYSQVESMSEISEALCIGQNWKDDVRVVLFVVLAANVKFGEDLRTRIKQKLRANASPRHVPAKIIEVSEIPRTRSGKIAELAVRDFIHGLKIVNSTALANPESLSLFAEIPELWTD